MKSEVEEKLIDIYLKQVQELNGGIVESKADVNNIDINSLSLSDIGFNSISFIKLIVEIENAFNIEFEDSMLDMGAFNSTSDFINYIEDKINENIV